MSKFSTTIIIFVLPPGSLKVGVKKNFSRAERAKLSLPPLKPWRRLCLHEVIVAATVAESD